MQLFNPPVYGGTRHAQLFSKCTPTSWILTTGVPPIAPRKYDEDKQKWTVEVEVDRNGETLTLRPTQLVKATGMSGIPNIPDIPGMDVFEGEQHHYSKHPGGEAYKGKKCIVLGANNSAHDICYTLWENEAELYQRLTDAGFLLDFGEDGGNRDACRVHHLS